jgi:multiple sugar transport system ATP-binding protein
MSVARNIGFGLHTARLTEAQKAARIAETAAALGLTELLERRPAQLSGGQRQRVAIGRAMVRDPVAFLFDEPLSNLDAQLRTQMRLEIKKLHQTLGRTIVFVTHDQVEAMTLADRIVVMRDGEILQLGTPDEVYRQPADTFVARFIGAPSMNLVPARQEAGALVAAGLGTLPHAGLPERFELGIRADDLRVGADAPLRISATVRVVEPLGPEALVYVDAGGQELVAKSTQRIAPRPGDTVSLGLDPADLHVFDATTGRAIRHGLA